jgi:hypothetical protein
VEKKEEKEALLAVGREEFKREIEKFQISQRASLSARV